MKLSPKIDSVSNTECSRHSVRDAAAVEAGNEHNMTSLKAGREIYNYKLKAC